MEENNKKENLKYAIAYIPLVAFFLYFTEKNISDEYKKHLKYAMLLFGIYVVISTVLRLMWMWWLVPMVFVVYLLASWFLAFKAYSWEKVEIDALDNLWNSIEEKLNNKK